MTTAHKRNILKSYQLIDYITYHKELHRTELHRTEQKSAKCKSWKTVGNEYPHPKISS